MTARHKHSLPVKTVADQTERMTKPSSSDIAASKKLSWLLRHGAHEAGVALSPEGWASLDVVLRTLKLSEETVHRVVQSNEKKRFELDESARLIRASQGHSEGIVETADVESTWTRFEGSGLLFHGTQRAHLPQIAREGLIAMSRTHVHLASSKDAVVGKRANVDVLLAIDPTRVREAGEPLFVSPNGVVLARRIPPSAIVGLDAMTRAARAEEAALKALFTRGNAP